MNPLEVFGEFSKKLTTTDLVLYAGAAMVVWVLFKEQLKSVFGMVKGVVNKGTGAVGSVVNKPKDIKDEDLFFALVSSWKNTRDLAEKVGCSKAVDAADEMFPYLSPVVCKEKKDENTI